MAFLSQASHLGSLLPPHDAFQEHAAHLVEWPAKLSSKGSERTCIRSGLTTFLHCTFTAHPEYVVLAIVTGGLQIVRRTPGLLSSCIVTGTTLPRGSVLGRRLSITATPLVMYGA